MNMRNVLDKQYYLQLKHINIAYRNTIPIQILKHLDTRWCPLVVRARKFLKAEFHANWYSTVMHLTAFGMKLNKEQAHINRLCRKPPRYVLYKGTFVPYDGTYGAPDQGQTLDV